MNHEMTRQFEILNELAQILHTEANCEYDNLSCCFTPIGNMADEALETRFVYTRFGKSFNVGISDENIFELVDLVIELQSEMKAHTGGEWTEFLLSINEKGNATTKFVYPDK